MSLSIGLIAGSSLLYVAILFGIAFYGDRRKKPLHPKLRAWVYSLSLAVYCSSWTFFGAVGQAATQVWSFLPIFLGPLLLMLIAPWVLEKMVRISKQDHITSIADFISARYGKSRALAVTVALICLVSVVPYIALQLKAIVMGVTVLMDIEGHAARHGQDIALVVSFALAVFAILFGTRSLDATEHHRGMVMAVAFESVTKLLAFGAVGVFVCFWLFGGFGDLFSSAHNSGLLTDYWKIPTDWSALLVQTLVAMMAIICLPRQFHVMVVENTENEDIRTARWLFPVYLILAALFIVPIALAGQMLLIPGSTADSFVISVPLHQGYSTLAVLAFLGGASAATGMVIVEAVALSTMVSNDILLPWLLARKNTDRPFEAFRYWMLSARRISILLILLMAYVCYRFLGPTVSLASIGLVAFAAITQLAPAMIGALLWSQANRLGVFFGLLGGIITWFYTMVVPLVANSLSWPLTSFPGLHFLLYQPLGFEAAPLTRGVVLSLAANFLLFFLMSYLTRTKVAEHWQAGRFVGKELDDSFSARSLLKVQLEDLLVLAGRFVGTERAIESFERFATYRDQQPLNLEQRADKQWIAHTERLLAGVLGSASTRLVVKAAIEGRQMRVHDVVKIVDEATEVLAFNRTLLQGAIQNISQGLSVVDQSLRLVAWNQRYLEIFDYPDGMIHIGRPLADLIRYNAERGLCGPGDPEVHVERRLNYIRQGNAHTSERLFPNGRVIELIGNPMPGGGFVMSFTDITAFREAERTLLDVNESLEQRVATRTRELSLLNEQLREAKALAEHANQSKSRFLAAVSHDLMQPLNAARLFSAALGHQAVDLPGDARELASHLDRALHSAEDLISDLLDISRLESGRISTQIKTFCLNDLYDALGAEFHVLAQEQGIKFRMRTSQLRIKSDPKLLRRVLQNFLTNAFRHANGEVLLGLRREPQHLRLEVWDRGPGIAADKLKMIFQEFKSLDAHNTRAEKGLGLGLAIAEGICQVLGHSISVRSWVGKGSVFSVTVPLSNEQAHIKPTQASAKPDQLSGKRVLCVDNEDSILAGMQSLLSRWGCEVWTARNRQECQALLEQGLVPQVALLDYHLDAGDSGPQVMAWLNEQLSSAVPGIIISADARTNIASQVRAQGLDFLPKPVKPAALRALLSRHLASH